MAAYILLKMSEDDSFIIGSLDNETENELILSYPIVIRLRATAHKTTNVSTSKMMPFSTNNLVSIQKRNIHAVSKPNERIIKYYLKFKEMYSAALDSVLEQEIVDLQEHDHVEQTQDEYETERFIEQQEEETDNKVQTRKGILH